jgi:sugar fermentation stimulation protein
MQLVYSFPELVTGKLLKRYKRFFADIELDNGQVITAHCANTGPMTGVSELGSLVAVSYQPSPKRKLAYSWEMIRIAGTWIGINTAVPNKAVGQMLAEKLIPELGNYDAVKSEVPFGVENSRADFLLVNSSHQTFVEVKNTTWSLGATAIFPDTVTTRGQKHLRELMAVVDAGFSAVILYFINRSDCDRFRAGLEVDRDYAILLEQAIAKGVQVLPCRFALDLSGIYYLGQADFISALA